MYQCVLINENRIARFFTVTSEELNANPVSKYLLDANNLDLSGRGFVISSLKSIVSGVLSSMALTVNTVFTRCLCEPTLKIGEYPLDDSQMSSEKTPSSSRDHHARCVKMASPNNLNCKISLLRSSQRLFHFNGRNSWGEGIGMIQRVESFRGPSGRPLLTPISVKAKGLVCYSTQAGELSASKRENLTSKILKSICKYKHPSKINVKLPTFLLKNHIFSLKTSKAEATVVTVIEEETTV
jgi:hypothetical protein